MWLVVIVIVYVVAAISIIISLLLNGVRPSKTLAWLLAIFTIPVGGILLYLLVGRNRRKQKVYRPHLQLQVPDPMHLLRVTSELNPKFRKVNEMVSVNTGYYLTDSNEITLLKDGKVTFTRIFDALSRATDFIHIQYYIFEEGDLADKLYQLFRSKIKMGIQVRLIYDSIGSYSLSKSYIKKLQAAGVEVYAFLPFRFGEFMRNLNYRNHRKVIVVDGKTAFTGGINVSDKYLKGDHYLGIWHDMNIELTGPSALHLNNVFLYDWELVSGKKLAPGREYRPSSEKGQFIQILPTGPDDDFAYMELLYFSLINNAEKYVYITNPYIIPSQAIQVAIQNASLSGVDVRLMVSAQADSKLVNWCVRSYFQRFLKAGVKIYQYPEGFLHSKIIVADDDFATIGTANVDDRSFQQNYEVNALIYNSETAMKLREDFLLECESSIQVNLREFLNRPWHHRLLEGAARTVSPLL